MDHPNPQRRPKTSPSFPKKLANFTSSTTGLDLTLRLIQALAQIAVELCVDKNTVVRCVIAKSQLALGRRYLRLFSFIDCFSRVSTLLSGSSGSDFDSDSDDLSPSISRLSNTMLTTLELVKSSCLGIYLLLENLTILHDMTIWPVPWSTPVLLEANKFWFYAICASIAGTVWKFLFRVSATETQIQSPKDQTRNQTQNKEEVDYPRSSSSTTSISSKLLTQILVDGCDLTLPASFLGWTPALGDLGVGMAMVVSTVLASWDVWIKAQR